MSSIPIGGPGYKRIGDYGIIGNMHSAALIGLDGSIAWCCFPRFDSPSTFAAILDSQKGGRWTIEPTESYQATQQYVPATNILQTFFQTRSGWACLTDFMPCFMKEGNLIALQEIHRKVECKDGEADLRMIFEPRLNYARGTTTVESATFGCRARNDSRKLSLTSKHTLNTRQDSAACALRLKADEHLWIVLKWDEEIPRRVEEYDSHIKLSRTEAFWRNWARGCRYEGKWREQVIRSALTLKLLIYEPSGALVAAPTASLPEKIGGERNWDYRYSWIRDSAFSLWAFHLLGKGGESKRYVEWLMNRCADHCRDIQIMYGVEGERKLDEQELGHLEGYRNSKPVRIGNDAYTQFQLDTYGILLDAVYFTFRHIGGVTRELHESFVRRIADYVCEVRTKPDYGIWEVRSGPRHFTHSKLWSYVALDRAVKIAEQLGYDKDVERWKPVKEEVRKEILTRGWSDEKRSFTMSYDSNDIGAGLLLMPLVKFLPANHPKISSTIERVMKELTLDGLVYRYKSDDGVPGDEGAFLICSFWLVDCLIELGRLDEAQALFGKLLSYANHVGLYSEEIDPQTGEALGNFPQAYTHMALINSAIRLDYALSRPSAPPEP